MTPAGSDAGVLLAGLREEAGIYTTVLGVSNEELKLVKDAELERATVLLSRKQEMLEDVAGIEKRIRPLKDRWPTIKADLPAAEQSQFAGVLKELSDLLEKLIAVERETEDILSRQIEIVRRGSGAAAGGAEERARKAYGAQKEREGRK